VLRELPGSNVQAQVTTVPRVLTLRVLINQSHARVLIDADRNGVFEQVLPVLALTKVLEPGWVGLTAAGGVELDEFQMHDAVVEAGPSAVPKLNSRYPMLLRSGELEHPQLYLAAASRTPGALPLGDGRFLLLGLDPLLEISIAWNGWLGLLFNHEGTITLEIPNDPLLVGLLLHVSAVTLQDNPPAILRVANDHQLRIVR
jgi:hypothetical protein